MILPQVHLRNVSRTWVLSSKLSPRDRPYLKPLIKKDPLPFGLWTASMPNGFIRGRSWLQIAHSCLKAKSLELWPYPGELPRPPCLFRHSLVSRAFRGFPQFGNVAFFLRKRLAFNPSTCFIVVEGTLSGCWGFCKCTLRKDLYLNLVTTFTSSKWPSLTSFPAPSSRCRPPSASPEASLSHSIGSSDGRCVQRAGT